MEAQSAFVQIKGKKKEFLVLYFGNPFITSIMVI